MRFYYLCSLAIAMCMMSCSTSKDAVVIPAQSKHTVVNAPTDGYVAVLDKRNVTDVDVRVLSTETGEQVKGFGLGLAGNVEVYVDKGTELVLENNSDRKARVKMKTRAYSKTAAPEAPSPPSPPSSINPPTAKEAPATQQKKVEYIEFTLRNPGLKSIPLIIPSVMNPNLSPNSRSGVSLKIGQEILFRYKGKKRVLLTVTDAIQNGDEINVKALLEKRKAEIDQQK